MTRSELIAALAEHAPYLRPADAEHIIEAIFAQITAALARGDRVELRGFGVFTVRRRNSRTTRNPRSGEELSVDETAVPFFRAGRKLRQRVNRPPRR